MAFTTLIDALVVALVALLPGPSLGLATVVLAGTGISSTIGMTVLSLRNWPGHRHLWDVVVIPVLGALYVLQLFNGAHLLVHPADIGAAQSQALLEIIFFVLAIAKAWLAHGSV